VKLALAGDTMLGRRVAERLESEPPESPVAPELVAVAREADLFVLNLECCISERGEPFPGRVFHFRAPPVAVETLAHLGVDCVTLANNHALDFGPQALLDTLHHVQAAGIASVGAGADREAARAPIVLEAKGFRLAVVAVTDHPQEYAAGRDRPGIAFADLGRGGLPRSLPQAIGGVDADAVLVTPHWGPNMAAEPVHYVRGAASALLEAGATLVAGHSAHIFQGVAPRVLYDLGDFLDDYRVDPELRNDLGLLFLVDLSCDRLEAIPLKLEFTHTQLASGDDAAWIERRFVAACAELDVRGGRRGRPPRHDLALGLRRLVAPFDPAPLRWRARRPSCGAVPADAKAGLPWSTSSITPRRPLLHATRPRSPLRPAPVSLPCVVQCVRDLAVARGETSRCGLFATISCVVTLPFTCHSEK
jgi:hypothetical protein